MNLIPRALAEAAETAAVPSAGNKLFALVFIVLGLYQLVQGIATMVTKKIYGKSNIKSYSKYTEESVRAYIVPIGLSSALVGAALIAISLSDLFPVSGNLRWILGAVLLVPALVIYFAVNKKLVKKEVR